VVGGSVRRRLTADVVQGSRVVECWILGCFKAVVLMVECEELAVGVMGCNGPVAVMLGCKQGMAVMLGCEAVVCTLHLPEVDPRKRSSTALG
jgi:hypothetical protein